MHIWDQTCLLDTTLILVPWDHGFFFCLSSKATANPNGPLLAVEWKAVVFVMPLFCMHIFALWKKGKLEFRWLSCYLNWQLQKKLLWTVCNLVIILWLMDLLMFQMPKTSNCLMFSNYNFALVRYLYTHLCTTTAGSMVSLQSWHQNK